MSRENNKNYLADLDNGKPVYLGVGGLRMERSRAKIVPVEEALGKMTKGEARRVRKGARRLGVISVAMAKREVQKWTTGQESCVG